MNPTQHRSVRVDDATWATFGDATAEAGGRASVLRRLITLYLTDRSLRRRVHAHADDIARDRSVVAAHR